jgi:hypothetical protein
VSYSNTQGVISRAVELSVNKNTTRISSNFQNFGDFSASGDYASIQACGVVSLAIGDYVEFYIKSYDNSFSIAGTAGNISLTMIS